MKAHTSRRPLALAVAVLASATLASTFAPMARSNAANATVTSDGCPRIVLYFSRGSGQELDLEQRGLDAPGVQLFDALVEQFGPGEVASIANGYPAVAVTRSILGSKLRLAKLFVGFAYRTSVREGVRSAVRNIADLVALCPHSDLVLAGYSQGAQVTRGALKHLRAAQFHKRIAAVILFGDPLFNPFERVMKSGGYEDNRRGILLQLHQPTTPFDPAYADKVVSSCHRFDVICQGFHGLKYTGATHGTYGRVDAEAALAAVASHLAAPGYRQTVKGTCARRACALTEWSGPGTTRFEHVGAAYEGQQIVIICQTTGEIVTGANGGSSAIWDRLRNGAFVPDYYIDTPGVGDFSPHIPRCQGPGVKHP